MSVCQSLCAAFCAAAHCRYVGKQDAARSLLHDRLQADVSGTLKCAWRCAQEDAWTVVTSFFDAKGLVRQQLDSFNEFVNSQMQEIVDESGQLIIKPESQHLPGQEEMPEQREIHISFNQIYLSKPTMTEADGETSGMFPNEARLRNLTCAPTLDIVAPPKRRARHNCCAQ